MINGATVCSGIGAAEWAAPWVDWKWCCELAKFPSQVLAERFPDVPNRGDLTKFRGWKHEHEIDLLCGGTPCQSFSVAGGRRGLEDARGNLTADFFQLAFQLRPRWVVWENVPGILSSGGGRDFGTILGALVHNGYSCAWRCLDVARTGTRTHPRTIPQRRRRIFLVGCLGDSPGSAAAILFDGQGVWRNSAPGGKAGGAGHTRGYAVGAGTDGGGRGRELAFTLQARADRGGNSKNPKAENLMLGDRLASGCGPGDRDVAHALRSLAAGRSTGMPDRDNIVLGDRMAVNVTDERQVANTLRSSGGATSAGKHWSDNIVSGDRLARTLTHKGHRSDHRTETFVLDPRRRLRRLMPVEWERLMGFPDGYTVTETRLRKDGTHPDAPRYAALGNAWGVNVAEWILDRIRAAEAERQAAVLRKAA